MARSPISIGMRCLAHTISYPVTVRASGLSRVAGVLCLPLTLTRTQVDMPAWYKFVGGLSRGIIASMRDRFPDGTSSKRWRCLDAAEFVGLPKSALVRHMHGEFLALLQHYNSAKNVHKLWPDLATKEGLAQLLSEFSVFKGIMWGVVQRYPNISTREAWALVARDHSATLPHILQLAAILFIIPCQTATVERGFSLHRVIKHRLTNQLRLVTLDSLMRVRLLSAPNVADFDFDAAVRTVNATGGLGSARHPMLIGRFYKAACDIDVPIDMAEGVDLVGDEEALNWPSGSESDSDFDPGQSDGEDSSADDESVVDSEGDMAEGAADMDAMREAQIAMGLE
jgi:hypothetical protein